MSTLSGHPGPVGFVAGDAHPQLAQDLADSVRAAPDLRIQIVPIAPLLAPALARLAGQRMEATSVQAA